MRRKAVPVRVPVAVRRGSSKSSVVRRQARAATSGRPARRAQRLISRAAPSERGPGVAAQQRGGHAVAGAQCGRQRFEVAVEDELRDVRAVGGELPRTGEEQVVGRTGVGVPVQQRGVEVGDAPEEAALPSDSDQRRAASPSWATDTATRGSGTESARATFSTRYARGSRTGASL